MAITLNLAYKFPQRTWGRSLVKTVTFSDEELQQMRDRLNAMNAENDALKRQLVDAGNKSPEIRVEKLFVASPYLITFPIGKSVLSKDARVNLNFHAKNIKNNSKVVYTIIGYADKGTGSKALNERLSKERAEAVYECLVKEFEVQASQLKVEYEGGVDNMFYDDPRLSRAVITEMK